MRKKILDFLGRPDLQPWPGALPSNAELGEPYVYRVPFPPPSGRRVKDNAGRVWMVLPTGNVARCGSDGVPEDSDGIAWGQLIATSGPLALVELTDDEKASEALYGPVGARWGHPGTPCNYPDCALYAGHATVHRDQAGNPIDVTDQATELYVQPPPGAMLSRVCTCGVIRHTATQHEPGCARYVTPRDVPPPPPVHQVHEMPDGSAFVGTAEEWLAAKGMTPGMIVVQLDESGHPGPIDPIAPAELVDPPAPDVKPRTRRTNSAGTRPTPPAGRKRAPRKGTGS